MGLNNLFPSRLHEDAEPPSVQNEVLTISNSYLWVLNPESHSSESVSEHQLQSKKYTEDNFTKDDLQWL